jgi:ADP-heptose:LPS heptosyltransferase
MHATFPGARDSGVTRSIAAAFGRRAAGVTAPSRPAQPHRPKRHRIRIGGDSAASCHGDRMTGAGPLNCITLAKILAVLGKVTLGRTVSLAAPV